MNTYTLTEIELTEQLRKQRELCANELPPKWKEALSPMILNAPLPPPPSGAKKEDIQPVPQIADNHVKESIISLFEECWFKHKEEVIFNAKLFGEKVAEFIENEFEEGEQPVIENYGVRSKATSGSIGQSWRDANDLGCTGHGDISYSDADTGL